MRKRFIPALIALMLCLPIALQAKVEHLLPKVHSLAETKGTPFALQRAVTITDANNTAALKKVFTDYGCTIAEGGATVTVEMVNEISGAYDYTLEGYDNEGYQLSVTENAIVIKAVKPIGVIRAAQTLAQLAEGYEEGQAAIETVEITDWAAFKLRGYMHDVGRSFISVAELKKHIDLLSRFKVNTFHWHFTENQAWRFEVEGYPQLTSTESMTRFAGKYYTQAECREVAQYAHERGVTIIPEIDMPGHSEAFHRAMGFDMQTDEGVDVLKKVLTQVAAVFPNAPYIHIGADEKGITYPNFLGIMADHIHGLGRKMIVWNPISGVSINNTMCDMTQMWSSRGADIKGVPDIDCRYNYTNHFDVFADVVGIYKSNIYYADKGSEEIAGTISAYWNDRKTPTEEDIVKQNNMYANVLASTERAWIGSKVNGAEGYIEKLGTTLPNSGEVYEDFKSWEERFLFHKANSLKDEPIPYVKQTNVRWRITDPFPNGGNSGATFAPDQYATSTNDEGLIPETFTHEGKTYYTGMATGAGIYLRHVWGNNTIPTYYGSTNHSNMTAYAWTYVYSETEQTVGAQIEFQNYGRSEHDKTPNADKWDRKGSDIWINGTRINPPTWKTPGFDPTNEDDLFNENFSAREPIKVTLKQGWNKVFLKLPYVGADGIRLNKWMFTCVFTDLEGKNAVEGLIYSPNQCLDEATELVAAKISEIKRDRGNLIGTAIGLWPESAATILDAKVREVETTYSTTKTAEERSAQVKELEAVWNAFFSSLASAKINQPIASTSDKAVYYRMCTPQRESRYPTAKGVGADIVGEQTPNDNSIWKFVVRTDGSFDIINAVEKSYVSPASDNNTALCTVADQPSAGWTIKAAASKGLVIITSGSVQFNQTNNSQLGYKVYNWGSGNNTTDTGCQYLFEEVEYTPSDVTVHEGLPVPGASYYIYADTYKDGKFLNRYLYNDNGTLKLSTELDKGANNYIWTAASGSEGKYSFANKAGKYLAHKGISDSKHEFTVAVSTRHMGVTLHSGNGKNYFVIHNADGRFDQSSITYDQTRENYCTDFVLVPVVSTENLPSLTVASPTLANATFTWNNEEITSAPYYLEEGTVISDPTLALKTYNKAYKFEGFYTDATYTTPLTSTTVETLTPGLTIYARFTLDMFSTNFGDKAIRLKMFRDASYSAGLHSASDDAAGSTQVCDLTATTELWYLVGNTDGFKLYNKGVGSGYALKVNGTGDGSAATMAAASSATIWRLVPKTNGYAIVPSNATGMSINAYGGKGGDLKLYSANDEGGWWTPEAVMENAFSLKVQVDQVCTASPRVAELNMTLNGVSSSTRIMGNVDEKIYYLPTYATTFSLSSMTYRGYTFNGFGEGAENYTDQEIPAEGVEIIASYTANNERTLYYNRNANNQPYRIPAIATAPNGTIFAIADNRPCGNDIGYGEVDIKCRISTDNGFSWGEEFFVADGKGGNTNEMTTGYGDAAIVADCQQNKLLVMMVAGRTVCHNGRWDKSKIGNKTADAVNRVARVYATYNEETKTWDWTQPEEVTDHIYSLFLDGETPTVTSMFIGSGKICQSRVVKKNEYYRLYCSMWTRDEGNRVIYSDDFGGTWNVLGTINDRPAVGGDEPKVEELPDGTVVLSSRKYSGRYFNLFTFDDNTYTTGKWGAVVASNEISGGLTFGGNSTNGEIYKVAAIRKADGAKCDIMFQSVPTGGSRSDVAVFYKEMQYNADGTNKYTPTTFSQGWTKGKHVSTKYSCYSTMIMQADGRIGFLFEEHPGDNYSYCIVYIPYSIEELTSGAYTIDMDYVGIASSILNTQPSTHIYDLMGRKVEAVTEHGIYIVGGKKVLK